MRILILIFFLILAIIGCFKIKTPVIYLIPYGYQGKILVIYGQERGRKEEFDGKNIKLNQYLKTHIPKMLRLDRLLISLVHL